MSLTRRELCALMPALLATATGYPAETEKGNHGTLPSAIYDFNHLPKHETNTGHQAIPVFQGKTYSGMPIELHETGLPPGGLVHGMYSHVGDELFLVREGILEVEFHGKRWEVGPGSVAYVASNTPYAVRNTGKEWARYFVFLFGPPHVPIHRDTPKS